MKTLSSVQEILDIHMKSNKEFAITLFRQLKRDSRIAWIHLQWIMDILPSSLELKDVAKENPEILLIKNSNPLKLGMLKRNKSADPSSRNGMCGFALSLSCRFSTQF